MNPLGSHDARPKKIQPDLVLRLTVPGEPVPKGRPRFGRGHAFTPATTRREEERVAMLAIHKLMYSALLGPTPTNCRRATDAAPRALTVTFYSGDHRRRDLDNLVKLVKDALNGVAWKDDSQVDQLHASRIHGDPNPRTEIAVHRMT